MRPTRSDSLPHSGMEISAAMLASTPTHNIGVRSRPMVLTAYDSACTVKIVLTEAITAATTTRSTSRHCSRKSTASGIFATVSVATSRSNAGVSSSVRLMITPAAATTTLSQNGTRQPQLSSCSSGRAATGRKIAVAMIWPACVPFRVKLV